MISLSERQRDILPNVTNASDFLILLLQYRTVNRPNVCLHNFVIRQDLALSWAVRSHFQFTIERCSTSDRMSLQKILEFARRNEHVSVGDHTMFIFVIKSGVNGIPQVRKAGREEGQTFAEIPNSDLWNNLLAQTNIIYVAPGFLSHQNVGVRDLQSLLERLLCSLSVCNRLGRIQAVENKSCLGACKLQNSLRNSRCVRGNDLTK